MNLPEPLDQLQHLALHGDVKRGRWFVGNNQARVAGKGHRNQHPLPHAAGNLVRIEIEHALRIADRDLGEKFHGAFQGPSSGQREMVPQNHCDLRADAPDRIQ